MTKDEIKALVLRFVDEALTKGHFEIYDELCAPEYTIHDPAANLVATKEDIKKQFADLIDHVENPKATIIEMIIEGDRVAYEWSWTGLIDGVETKNVGMTILHLRDGKIIQDRVISATVKEQEAVA